MISDASSGSASQLRGPCRSTEVDLEAAVLADVEVGVAQHARGRGAVAAVLAPELDGERQVHTAGAVAGDAVLAVVRGSARCNRWRRGCRRASCACANRSAGRTTAPGPLRSSTTARLRAGSRRCGSRRGGRRTPGHSTRRRGTARRSPAATRSSRAAPHAIRPDGIRMVRPRPRTVVVSSRDARG